ncbi:MAG: TonB-dependent receptor plug domain-containing protein, partial [Bacteroidota bacterium]
MGDTLYYSAYIVNGMDHKPSQLSGLLHVQLSGASGTYRRAQLQIDPLGRANGDFALVSDMAPGDYYLRAYTNYQLNFDKEYVFSKAIRVLPRTDSLVINAERRIKQSAIQLDLFPEGGDLIAGGFNFLAFKATNEWGSPADISGKIIDDTGEEKAAFASKHDGMGVTQFFVEEGANYRAVYEHQGVKMTQMLPPVLPSGYLLQVRNFKDRVMLIVKAMGAPLAGTFMIVQCRGDLIYTLQSPPGQPYMQNVILRSELPSGILQLTFFDQDHKPVAERLIYNENPNDQTQLQITTNQPSFSKRSRVDWKITMQQAEERAPAMASVSTTVLPKELFVAPRETIASYLLFTSDLKGRIHHPAQYLDKANPNRQQQIDFLMMTHGWRRFNWEQVMEGKLTELNYPIETGITVEGRVTKHINRQQGVATDLYLGFLGDPLAQIPTQSSEDGSFRLEGIEFVDTLDVFVKTLSDKDRKRAEGKVRSNTFVHIHEKRHPPFPFDPHLPWQQTPLDQFQIERGAKLFDIAAAFDENTIMLEEILVADEREEVYDPFEDRQILYAEPNFRIMIDSVPAAYQNTLEYLLNLPGVRLIPRTDVSTSYTVQIRGATNFRGNVEPLFLLDGMPMPLEVANNIPVHDVLFIDVLRGPEAAIYGSRGGSGVIAMYTRRGGEGSISQREPIGLTTLRLAGFTAPRQFYMPDHGNPSEDEKSDQTTEVPSTGTHGWRQREDMLKTPSTLQMKQGSLSSTVRELELTVGYIWARPPFRYG